LPEVFISEMKTGNHLHNKRSHDDDVAYTLHHCMLHRLFPKELFSAQHAVNTKLKVNKAFVPGAQTAWFLHTNISSIYRECMK